MNNERPSTRIANALEALSRASAAEMLREMEKSLRRLVGCAYLSPVQERHINSAARHLSSDLAEWIKDVMQVEAIRISDDADCDGNVEDRCSGCPYCPGRDIGEV